MSVPSELDRRAEALNAKLKKLLLLFLADQISAQLAKGLADEYILEEYISLIVYVRRKYDPPAGFNAENRRIKKVLDQIKADFHAIIDREGEKISDEDLKRRTWYVALGFVYGFYAQAVIEVAIIKKAKWLEYHTAEDPKVCSICHALKGVYSIYEVLPEIPQHVSCRCWWEIIV